jgi:hypothetical protein
VPRPPENGRVRPGLSSLSSQAPLTMVWLCKGQTLAKTLQICLNRTGRAHISKSSGIEMGKLRRKTKEDEVP